MSAFTPVFAYIQIAQNTQYMAARDIVKYKRLKGVTINDYYPTLVRIVRDSLDWATSQGSSTLEVGGDFLSNDFAFDDFLSSASSGSSLDYEGLDLISLYLYALCGSYIGVASEPTSMPPLRVYGIEFNSIFSVNGGGNPSPVIGLFSFEFNGIFN